MMILGKKGTSHTEEAVLARIDRRRIISILQGLVKLPSINPPGEELAVARFGETEMTRIGLNVALDEYQPNRPNVYGVLRGSGSTGLVLTGHLDVVPVGQGWTMDPFGGVLKDGKVYGRGATDMKGGCAAMIAAAEAIAATDPHLNGTLEVALVVEEEETGKGTAHLLRNGPRWNWAIVGEPTELKVVIAHKGDVYYEIKTIGREAHSSRPEQGTNAIYKTSRIIDAIEQFCSELKKKKHPRLGSPTISVGTVIGGSSTCVVPGACAITVDRRTIPGESAITGREELEAIIRRLQKTDPDLNATVRVVMEADPMEVSEDQQLVRCLRESTKLVTGSDSGVDTKQGCTDARFFASRNVPVAVFGPGSSFQAHIADEYVEVNQVVDAAKIYALTALRLLE